MRNTACTVTLQLTILETVAMDHDGLIAKYQDIRYKIVSKNRVTLEIIHVIQFKFA